MDKETTYHSLLLNENVVLIVYLIYPPTDTDKEKKKKKKKEEEEKEENETPKRQASAVLAVAPSATRALGQSALAPIGNPPIDVIE